MPRQLVYENEIIIIKCEQFQFTLPSDLKLRDF